LPRKSVEKYGLHQKTKTPQVNIMSEQIIVKSAFEMPENQLIDFYAESFENRMQYLPKIWQWLNRSQFYGNKTPLVIEREGKVIAHAGMIPFFINLQGKKHTASWFIDFKISEAYQRQGIGSILTKEWVNFSDCCVTFCNEKSIGVFKKIGWQESFNTFQHFNFMHLFDHPAFVRKLPAFARTILNLTVLPFFFILYKKNSYSKKNYKIEKLTDENFAEFYEFYKGKNQNNENRTSPIRDDDFVAWRILNSPNREKYFIYSCENFRAIALIHDNHSRYIDILWVSDNQNKQEISKMISTLGIYGLRKGIAYIRFYTSYENISKYLKKTTLSKIRHIRFAFFSTDKEIFEEMKTSNFDFELLDGDFEHIR
jgi:hypothetical protein